MPAQFTAGRFKAWSDSGVPLTTARLYTYSNGTTTQKNAFTTAALSTPCTYTSDGSGGTYIAMNSRGEALLWLGSGTYTLTLKTSAGATIWSADDQANEQVNSLATFLTSTGSTLIGWIQAGTGAVLRTLRNKCREVFSYADFDLGYDLAVIADSTAGMQAALNACPVGGTVLIPPCPGSMTEYVLTAPLTIPHNDMAIGAIGHARPKITASGNAVGFDYMISATSRSRVHVFGLHLNANKTTRSAGTQVTRYLGVGLITCDDSFVENMYIENTRGFASVPATGLTITGGNRCGGRKLWFLNNGDAGAFTSDGAYVNGDGHLIEQVWGVSVTDTVVAFENTNRSFMSQVTGSGGACVAAIVNSSNSDTYGNGMSQIVSNGGSASVTGIIQIGNPSAATTGVLYDTVASDILISNATGPGMNIRKTGTPLADGVTVRNLRVRTASTQGVLVQGKNVTIDADITGTTNACIQFQDGSLNGKVPSGNLYGGTYGVYAGGNADVNIGSGVTMNGQSAYNVYAADTSIIRSSGQQMFSPGVAYMGKAAGATVFGEAWYNGNRAVLTVLAGAPGAATGKITVLDMAGAATSYVAVT